MNKLMVKKRLQKVMEACDLNSDLDFLDEVNKVREEAVYQRKEVTVQEFNDIVREIVNEMED